MEDEDEAIFQRRLTLIAVTRTLGATATIRDSALLREGALDATIAAPVGAPSLPHISLDLRNELGARDPDRRSDLSIVKTIGEGGMGRVHLARQHSLDREVAVKTLKEDASPLAVAGLLREAKVTGSLEHPGVIPVHALGTDDRGGPLLVMKRVDGVDWSTLLADAAHPHWNVLSAGADRLAANLEILAQVCKTMEFAHSRGVLHRDIKPENVMVGGYGEVYLVDWGIAIPKTAAPSKDAIAGTPAYMAPEMFLGGVLDERTDVYLLGATLHEVLTSRCRHEGRDVTDVLRSALRSAPIVYDGAVPEHLALLCNAATTREPDRRPKDVRAFRDELTDFLHRRSAMALCDAASARLAQLNALLAAAEGNGVPRDLAAAYRLATEARFGFNESLREHPSSEAARAGVRSSVTALVELELRQRHADTAEALLRELSPSEPALAERVAAVRARDEADRVEARRLEALGRDLDSSVHASTRSLGLVAVFLLVTVLAAVALWKFHEITPWRAVSYGAGSLVVVTIGTALLRKRVFANAYNARLTMSMIAVSVLMVAQRVIAALHDTTVERMFAGNLWLLTASLVVAAIAIERRLLAATPPVLVAACLLPWFPTSASLLFSVGLSLSLVVTVVVLGPKPRA